MKLKKDLLGNRMKDNYENRYRFSLTRRTPVIIRIDGKAFHTYTRGFEKPWDTILINTMLDTAWYLCTEIMGCKLAYIQSDEISLLLTDYDKLTSEAWFNNNLQKICSVSASMATMAFNSCFANRVNNSTKLSNILNDSQDENFEKIHNIHKERIGQAMFDARAFNIPENEVVNYFIWRQNDATRNSINSLGYANFSSKELHGLNNSQVQEKLFQEKGINWNDCSTVEKRGTCVIKKEVTKDTQTPNGIIPVVRNEWVIDEDIPIFTQDRNYIESVLPEKDPVNNNPTH